MSRLLKCPAAWPALALNPEPIGTGIDPESVERLFAEWMGPRPMPRVSAPALDKGQDIVPHPHPRYRHPAQSRHLHLYPRRW